MATSPVSALPLTSVVEVCNSLGLGSVCSQMFVLHKDTLTVNTAPTDPYAQIEGSPAADAANCILHTVPKCFTSLDMYHMYLTASPGTALKVIAWGLVPCPITAGLNRLMPEDLGGAIGTAYDTLMSSRPVSGGIWRRLPNPLDGSTEHTFSNTPDITNTAGTPDFFMSERKTVLTLGASKVLVTVSQAAATNLTSGLLLGCLGN